MDNSEVGFYFAAREEVLADGARFHQGLGVFISDFPPERNSNLGPAKNAVIVRPWSARETTNIPTIGGRGALVSTPMKPPDLALTREFRTIIVECQPSGLGLWWLREGERVSATPNPVPATLIRRNLDAARELRVPDGRGPNADPVSWSAGGIGIIAVRGQVSVRRLSICRLKDE
jgi:hypothetical protein